ncbi:MAG: glutaredoxin family protein [Nitriliruptor sp.]|nr:MAG: glutaredoxin family protein [Nitriliruptor sp.]
MRRRRHRARPVVTLYTRAGCGLCERAGRLARREAGRGEFRTVDVDTDPALVRRYGVRVPVITVDDVEVAELELSPGQVRRAVRTARQAARPRG